MGLRHAASELLVMRGVKLNVKISCMELRQKQRLEDITAVLQRIRIIWYGNVLRKNDNYYRAMHVVLARHCYRRSSVCPSDRPSVCL